MKDKYNIFITGLCCIVIIIIFGYTIVVGEEDEERNASINFNQVPDVDIKPINNIINKTTDGSVDLFASNPSSNQFILQVDFIAIVPHGITLNSDSVSLVEKPDAFIASFQVLPGQKKEILIRVKSSNIGNYSVQYNEVYYPVGNKQENIKNVIFNYVVEESSQSSQVNNPIPTVVPMTPTVGITDKSDYSNNTQVPEYSQVTGIPTVGITDLESNKSNDGNETPVPTTKKAAFIPIGNVIAILMMVFLFRKMIKNK